MNEALRNLAGLSGLQELESGPRKLCLPFGAVKRVRILPNRNHREHLCFVELDPPSQYSSLVESLGGVSFGNAVVLRVPFDKEPCVLIEPYHVA